jgi:hypothetical protein
MQCAIISQHHARVGEFPIQPLLTVAVTVSIFQDSVIPVEAFIITPSNTKGRTRCAPECLFTTVYTLLILSVIYLTNVVIKAFPSSLHARSG